MITHVHSATINVRDLGDGLLRGRAGLADVPTVSFALGCGISLITDDTDGAVAGLVAKGELETMPWGGRATWFSDPFGNEFFLVQLAS